MVLLLLALVFSPAQDVAEEELQIGTEEQGEYINYSGPHAFLNTAEEIRSIGRELEQYRRQDGRTGLLSGKYSLTRILPPGKGSLFGADILSVSYTHLTLPTKRIV